MNQIHSEKHIRREFRLVREALEKDIQAHKKTLEEVICQLNVHSNSLGFKKTTEIPASWVQEALNSGPQSVLIGLRTLAPVLDFHNEQTNHGRLTSRKQRSLSRAKRQAEVSEWVSTTDAEFSTVDVRLSHPDPDDDSEAETAWNPRVKYEDLNKSFCDRKEWLIWINHVWEKYSSLKIREKSLKNTLTNITATCNTLIRQEILNDSALTPQKYTILVSQQALYNAESMLKECRKLRSRIFELLPAFEWHI